MGLFRHQQLCLIPSDVFFFAYFLFSSLSVSADFSVLTLLHDARTCCACFCFCFCFCVGFEKTKLGIRGSCSVALFMEFFCFPFSFS